MRRAMMRRQARLAVEAKLEEAKASGQPILVTAKTWRESEKRVVERLKALTRKPRTGKSR
jgi:hypothetical protein